MMEVRNKDYEAKRIMVEQEKKKLLSEKTKTLAQEKEKIVQLQRIDTEQRETAYKA